MGRENWKKFIEADWRDGEIRRTVAREEAEEVF